MERARPILNWICSIWLVIAFILLYMTTCLLGGMDSAMNPNSHVEMLPILALVLIGGAPYWTIPLLILVLLNVKFSIGWRQ